LALVHSDILHPNRANISKEELREKLAGMYKAQKDQVNVFGLRTQFGGGKTTGFALVYDSPEAMKKFEPHFRLVRVGMANKIEKASRQQRTLHLSTSRAPHESMEEEDSVGWSWRWLTIPPPPQQASSARTGRRLCGVPQRSRAPRRRRRNERLAFPFGVVCYTGYLGGWDDGYGFVHYPGLLVATGQYDAVSMQLESIMEA
jgi:ribosomal protein S24E